MGRSMCFLVQTLRVIGFLLLSALRPVAEGIDLHGWLQSGRVQVAPKHDDACGWLQRIELSERAFEQAGGAPQYGDCH
jgi:hypothetical protein